MAKLSPISVQAHRTQSVTLGDQKWDAKEVDALAKLGKTSDGFAKDGLKFMLDELNSGTPFDPSAKDKLFGVLVYEARIDPRQIKADPPPVTLAVQEGSSNKFYQLSLDGAEFTKSWGKIGAAPSSKTEVFSSAADAKKAFLGKLREQLGKGYQPADAAALGLKSGPVIGGMNPPADAAALGLNAEIKKAAPEQAAPAKSGLPANLAAFAKLPESERLDLLDSWSAEKAGLKTTGELSIDAVKSPQHKAFAEKMRQAAEDAVSFQVEEDEYLTVGPPKVSVEIFSLPNGDIVGGTLSVHQTGVERPDDYYDNEDKYPEKKLKQMAAETDVSWGMSGVYGNTPSGEIDRLKDPDYMEWSGY